MMARPVPLLLFAKAPVPGKVKTRLKPQCTDQQAAELAKILLAEAVRNATAHWPGEVVLAVWPDQDHPFIQLLSAKFGVKLVTQTAGDLGEKMHAACEQAGYPAAVMGCDAPHVSKATLNDAYHQLEQGHDVLGAATDGGYYLIGMARSCEDIFTGITWGEDKVFSDTQKKASANGIKFHALPELNDVDTWQDVLELAELLPAIKNYIVEQDLV